jgi:uncharacterized protein YmfQ (DUF2313 family)
MATPPAFGNVDYQQALLNLMPRGRIWRRDPEAIEAQLLGALAPTYTRSTEAAAQLMLDASPATTFNLLTEWEESLGLPDPCTPLDPTFEQRQLAVAANWGARGDMTVDYYVTLAAALGFEITITEFAPSRFGKPFGQPFYGVAWAFVWQVNAPTYTVEYLEFGQPFGEAFSTYGNTEMQCRIKQAAPAHTTVLFNYS